MRVREGSCTLVLAGFWNKFILTPEWLSKYIFKDEQLKIDIAFNLTLPNRFTSDKAKVMLVPSPNNVTLVALQYEDQCLKNTESIAYDLVSLLPRTPVQAFGFNFGYMEKINEPLMKLFDFYDNDQFNKQKMAITNSLVQRRIIIKNRILNLRITHDNENILFDFNYHYDTNDSEEIQKRIHGTMVENKSISEDLLRSIYDLSLDNVKEV